MKTFIIMLLILFITSPLLSSQKNWQGNTRVFTDEDLEQYGYPSERRKSVDDVKTPKDATDSKDSKKIADKEKQPLKRYEVSYKAYEGMARRIIIPVRFNDSVTAPMVLDTGATGRAGNE